ncbi:protein phosphatase [Massilia solisilvae]|uniref:Protein phosphatase n=2 Tax=Massilia solisilvae TaxID=1811225 RepID=A0ABT2BM64_9BURK|nr:protein phosphatase [Massilia solisilvae]
MTMAPLDFGPRFDVAARSSAGAGELRRPENQDNYLMIDPHGMAAFLMDQRPRRQPVPGWTGGHARVAVLDGMGGHVHGREAAEAVATGLLAVPPCSTVTELSRHLDALHTRLQHHFARVAHSPLRPGTTLTLLELPPHGPALLYHVGDSRLYEIAGDHASVLTIDHVPATAVAMAGLLDERAWWQQVHGEHRPVIAQAFILGNSFDNPAVLADPLHELAARELPPWLAPLHDRRAIALRPGAAYLLATDGFWSCAGANHWVARWPALLQPCTSAAAMVDALFREMETHPPPGLYPDNLTALVLRPLAAPDETVLPGH